MNPRFSQPSTKGSSILQGQRRPASLSCLLAGQRHFEVDEIRAEHKRARCWSLLNFNQVSNFCVLCPWKNVPRDQVTRLLIRTSSNDAICLTASDAGQRLQLFFGCGVQVEWLVPAPALANPRGYRLSISFYLCRGFGGFLFQVLRVLSGASHESREHRE